MYLTGALGYKYSPQDFVSTCAIVQTLRHPNYQHRQLPKHQKHVQLAK